MGIDMLVARFMLRVGLPGVQRADELRQRVTPIRPGRVILRKKKSRRMGREPAERDPADVAALSKLGHMCGDRVVEFELALADGLSEHGRFEHLAQRRQSEQRVGR